MATRLVIDGERCTICSKRFVERDLVSVVCPSLHMFHFDCYVYGHEVNTRNKGMAEVPCPICWNKNQYGGAASYLILGNCLTSIDQAALPPPPPPPRCTPLPPLHLPQSPVVVSDAEETHRSKL